MAIKPKTNLLNLAAWILGPIALLFIVLRAMGSIQVEEGAQIILAKHLCPAIGVREENGLCVVSGSLSRRFLSEQVEITLPDETKLIVQKQDVLAYSSGSSEK